MVNEKNKQILKYHKYFIKKAKLKNLKISRNIFIIVCIVHRLLFIFFSHIVFVLIITQKKKSKNHNQSQSNFVSLLICINISVEKTKRIRM